MKLFILTLVFITSSISAQDRLSFVKDENVKKEMQKGIEFYNKTNKIPKEIRDKIVFISFEIEELLDYGNIGIIYSTYVPIQIANFNNNGYFETSPNNKILYFNYSKNIVLVLLDGFDFFDQVQMKFLSKKIQISKKNLMQSEYFQYTAGNEYTLDSVDNFISLDKVNGNYIPVRANTFDVKTFIDVWCGVIIGEIPVSQNSKIDIKKSEINNFHTHPLKAPSNSQASAPQSVLTLRH